jgi:hypothetical protein
MRDAFNLTLIYFGIGERAKRQSQQNNVAKSDGPMASLPFPVSLLNSTKYIPRRTKQPA